MALIVKEQKQISQNKPRPSCVSNRLRKLVGEICAWALFNSSHPSAACIHQWIGSALVQIMACRLNALPSHYLRQWWVVVHWTLRITHQWNLNRNTKFFIHENTFENVVCEMAAILARWDESNVITSLAMMGFRKGQQINPGENARIDEDLDMNKTGETKLLTFITGCTRHYNHSTKNS